jgi:hypothetical protein
MTDLAAANKKDKFVALLHRQQQLISCLATEIHKIFR